MMKCPCGLAELGLSRACFRTGRKGVSRMRLSRTRPATGAVLDDRNLVSAAGLVPTVSLAQSCRLPFLSGEHVSVPVAKGANAGRKVMSLLAGMVAGADSIDDMALLRHGAIDTLRPPVRTLGVGFVAAVFHLRPRPTSSMPSPAGCCPASPR